MLTDSNTLPSQQETQYYKVDYVHGISIDYSRDSLFDKYALRRLKDSYMLSTENSPQERLAFVAKSFGSNEEHSQRLYNYASKHWLSFSTPILSFGRTKNGLPISCYLTYMEDTSQGLVDTMAEVAWLSMLGGGVGIHVGIRSADEKSTGVMPHLKVFDAETLAYRQSSVRRGSYATFLDISHPDIRMFIEMRKPTGDPNLKCPNLHHGVNISDKFMTLIEECMIDPNKDDSWELIDPKSKKVIDIISAKELWQSILTVRMEKGEPYIVFIDTANSNLPKHLKEKNYKINGSNICVEIMLPTSKDKTAVCCLSSVNLEYFDQWKDNEQFIPDIMEMLDNVLEYFIKNAPEQLYRAKNSAKNERDVGLGALGFHSYLQSKNIPFESALAVGINKKIFKHIRQQADKANLVLGKSRGEAPDAKGTGKRFSHLMAIAPNASTATIMGNCSPSIELHRANIFRQDTLSGALMVKNRYLDKIIKNMCQNNTLLNYDKIWSEITVNNGSIKGLGLVDEWTEDVFKTALEVDQRWVIQHAADRQEFIDQAQSLNLFFSPEVDIKYLHEVHFSAWKKGLKTLYYCRSDKAVRAEKVGQKIEKTNYEGCLACE